MFIPYGLLQLISIHLFYRRVSLKRSNHVLLLDMAIYTFVSCLSRTISDFTYLLKAARNQFTERYPLYPPMPLLHSLVALGAGSCFASCMLLLKMLKHRHRETEVSLLCKVVLTSIFGLLCLVLYYFINELATVNCLDLANLFRFFSLFTWSCRLIPQVSVNWFYDNFAVIHKYFIQLEVISILYVMITYWLFEEFGGQWHTIPLNAPLFYVAVLSIIPVCLLALESRIYSKSSSLPR